MGAEGVSGLPMDIISQLTGVGDTEDQEEVPTVADADQDAQQLQGQVTKQYDMRRQRPGKKGTGRKRKKI